MKQFLSVAFICLLLLQSTTATWVLLNFELNRDVISKNSCINRFDRTSTCHGSCVLKKELQQQDEQQEKLPQIKKSEILLISLRTETAGISAKLLDLFDTKALYINPSIPESQPSSIFHPPCLS